MIRRILATAAIALVAGVASAQDGAVRATTSASGQQGVQVRLNVNMNFFVPGPVGLDEQGMQSQERARRLVYRVAVHECTVLRETIASDCRMESINVNANRHQGQVPDGYSVTANIAFRVTLK